MFDQTLIRICLIFGSLVTAWYILRRVRQAKVQIEDTIFWLLFSAALLILAIFPGIAYWAANLLGFMSPINFVYVVIIFLLLGVVTWIVWNKTRFGKNMFAVGGNSEAAEVSGVSVTKTIMGVFLYAGLMYGIASFLEGARIQSVGTATGINYELDAIAGCVIGGVSFNGGIGTVPGVVIGSIILQAINYGLYFLGVNAYLQYIIRGAIIIIAVAIDVQKYVAKK